MNVYRIYITPSLNNNKTHRHNSRGPLFDARYEDTVIVRNSTEPGLDSARVLKMRGLKGLLEVWDDVLPYWRFRLEIDKAAGLTIQEGEGRPIYRKFKSFAGPQVVESVLRKAGAEVAAAPKELSALVPPTIASSTDVVPQVAASEVSTAQPEAEADS